MKLLKNIFAVSVALFVAGLFVVISAMADAIGEPDKA